MTSLARPVSEIPVGVPVYGIGMWDAFKRFWKGFFVFTGRASRSEYWLAMLTTSILITVLMVITMIAAFGLAFAGMIPIATDPTNEVGVYGSMAAMIGSIGVYILGTMAITLPFAVPAYSIMARRLRDAGMSPWLCLLSLVGLSIVPMIMCIMETKPEGQYGSAGGYPGAPYAGQGQAPQQYAPQQYGQQYAPQQYGR